MTNISKKLSKLIVGDELNIDILADILERFVKLNPSKGQIIILPDFFKLIYKDAITVILLAFKALKELKARNTEMAGPKEVAINSGINLSTVKNSLRDLEKDRFATSIKGKYTIHNFLLYNLKDKFNNLELEISTKKMANKRGKSVAKSDFLRISKILSTEPEKFSGLFYDFLTEKRGEYFKKSLVLIKLAKDQFDIEGLTTAEITEILRYIGTPVHQPNISTALGHRQSLRYILKEPTSRKKTYAYKLTKKGKNLVDEIVKLK